MSTRLDRLLVLLDTGSSPTIRKTAADQLGDVLKIYPSKLSYLLSKIHKLLSSKSWDTRIAAGHSVYSIMTKGSSNLRTIKSPILNATTKEASTESTLSFSNFSLDEILENGVALLASVGTEFDVNEDDLKNNISKQKHLMIKKLGLDIGGRQLMSENELFTDDDLQSTTESNRLANRNKRRNMKLRKQLSCERSGEDGDVAKQLEPVDYEADTAWPIGEFFEFLLKDLFHPTWEFRHGAATALTHILSSVDFESEDSPLCINCALKLVAILSLDQFGDFISDEVVAPVRETSAQALGASLKHLSKSSVLKIAKCLTQMCSQSNWEVQHGGMLGIKYLLAVRQDDLGDLINDLMKVVLTALRQGEDDVKAAAAASIAYVADRLIVLVPEYVNDILDVVWQMLDGIDETTSSTASVVILLAAFISHEHSLDRNSAYLTDEKFDGYIPRLWPLLRHPHTLVRINCLRTFLSLLSIPWLSAKWVTSIAPKLASHLFLLTITEVDVVVLSTVSDVWIKFLTISIIPEITRLFYANVKQWFEILTQNSFVYSTVDVLPNANCPSKAQYTQQTEYHLGGLEPLVCTTEEYTESVCRARLRGCRFMGCLVSRSLASGVSSSEDDHLKNLQSLFSVNFDSKCGTLRIVNSYVIYHAIRFDYSVSTNLCCLTMQTHILQCLSQNIYYDEMAPIFLQLQGEASTLLRTLKLNGVCTDELNIANVERITYLTTVVPGLLVKVANKKIVSELESLNNVVLTSLDELKTSTLTMNMDVNLALAACFTATKVVPVKLNPIVRPIMECLKKCNSVSMRSVASLSLANLIESCHVKYVFPVSKILGNVCSMLFSDEQELPTSGLTLLGRLDDVDIANSDRLRYSLSLVIPRGHKVTSCQYLGALETIQQLCICTGSQLLIICPKFSEIITNGLNVVKLESGGNATDSSLAIIQSIYLLQTILPHCHDNIRTSYVAGLIHSVGVQVKHPSAAVRYAASRCLGVAGHYLWDEVTSVLIYILLPGIEAENYDVERIGSMEAIFQIVATVFDEIIPLIPVLLMSVLSKMSDFNQSIRLMASKTFCSLVKLFPLCLSKPGDEFVCSKVENKCKSSFLFLEQLLNPKLMGHCSIQLPFNTTLRSYQQEGVNWLAFLNKYNLHGILCDDLGLGKSLMTLCVIASDIHTQMIRLKNKEIKRVLISLIICPPVLIGHWEHEIQKFFEPKDLSCLSCRTVKNLKELSECVANHDCDILLASYENVRNDISWYSQFSWNYLVLDEGHVIRNSKTKISKACKAIKAKHRLILTGTPIQNNVLDLWSLFDFIMPGFLGTESSFQTKFGKPINNSKWTSVNKSSPETGILAIETLHHQVLPFILRRMKEDVLEDLPPKIIQDHYCELSPLQVKLYESFSSKLGKQSEDSSGVGQIFKSLTYLRNVCNHPKLVMGQSNAAKCTDLSHAPKLNLLRELLSDCCIGGESDVVVNQHRALIFCQSSKMLNIIENDLFNVHMPKVSFSRLDGTIPVEQRHSVVTRFNDDPSIDVLLLTTHIGGLGLNLTGADVVILYDHDWNPMKDLQAMDRAHRIGQTKSVNVFRLITKGTLEEKIMGLQQFKLHVANTVVSEDNAGLLSMNTGQVLDLFSISTDEPDSGDQPPAKKRPKTPGLCSELQKFGELWDDAQYNEQYDIKNYLNSLTTNSV